MTLTGCDQKRNWPLLGSETGLRNELGMLAFPELVTGFNKTVVKFVG